MTQEELKTCLGQLLLDLRGNWAYNYSDRLEEARWLCDQIEDYTDDVVDSIDSELERGYYDGRIFKSCSFYGYKSDEGSTEAVKKWLIRNLTHPEYCELLQ
jgi:hypothetical protein